MERFWDKEDLQEVSPSGRKSGPWEHPLKEIQGPQCWPLSCPRPKSNRQTHGGLERTELRIERNLWSFKVDLSQVFGTGIQNEHKKQYVYKKDSSAASTP